ncbi:hypothetical protein FHX49_000535 [Microbacterium endophyticum]|uniref:Uncharacterized protein n=1 Tax=Microbacterium endophyticum TaxID=1526412 RepID=A0A7W4YLZ4_9MICO|nr:hypothetical protein [Microbacterium endophyticum]NIK37291.1 hypothetical protein [Microbacterium endophyticum]
MAEAGPTARCTAFTFVPELIASDAAVDENRMIAPHQILVL